MARPSRSTDRTGRVRIRRHAWERVEERLPGKKLTPDIVRRHIDGALRAGVPVNSRGAIELPIGGGAILVCVPEMWGGWSVVTVLFDPSRTARAG